MDDDSNIGDELVMGSKDPFSHYLIQNAEVSAQTSQCSPEVISTSKKAARGGNFSVAEDKHLVSSWLHVSLDAVQASDQKFKGFWARLHAFYFENKKFTRARSPHSLQHRWSVIQLATKKFCGCFSQIQQRCQSGVSEVDMIEQAKEYYNDKVGNSYQFEHCWHILRFHPKWIEEYEKRNPKKNSPCPPESSNVGEDGVPWDSFMDLEQRPGSKGEKQKEKKEKCEASTGDSSFVEILNGIKEEQRSRSKAEKENEEEKEKKQKCEASTGDSSLLEILNDIKEEQKKMNEEIKGIFERLHSQENERLGFERQRLHIEQERVGQERERVRQEQVRIELEQEKIRTEQIKEEERIVTMDTRGLPPLQKDYFECRQNEILQKRKRV